MTRRKKLWIGSISAALVGVAVVVLARSDSTTQRRFLIPQSFSGEVYLIHRGGYYGPDNAGGQLQTMKVPPNGILVTADRMPNGFRDTYFDVLPGGGLAQLLEQDAGEIQDKPENRNNPARLVFNPSAGVMELPNCKVTAEFFFVGTRSFLIDDRTPDALESYAQAHPEVCVHE